ncbi:hypothetical protein E4U31_001132 [Claviceps sp. LM219 group G6]|nr:hypothetical protein E4U31_001132 [Claviceps sp. LM219 group G6]KAG6107829.1 hypothetical protein E4U14_003984 [Claviceps sp. LM454 group G7]
MFSFAHTESSTDLLNGSWQTAGDGSQNFQDYSDHGSCHSGEAEDYLFTSGHTTPRGSRLEQTQIMDSVWNNPRITAQGSSSMAQAMARADSSQSSGSSLSQSSHMSRGNARGFAHTVAGPLTGMDSCLLVSDVASANPHMYWSDLGIDMNMSLPASAGVFTIPEAGPMHMMPAQMHLGPDSVLPDNSSPVSWDCFSSSISRTSSPATIDDTWLPGALSPHSPEILGNSPRYVHHPGAQPAYHASSRLSHISNSVSAERNISLGSDSTQDKIHLDDGNLTISTGFTPRRHGSEGESSARDHELYKNAAPGPDGLFHCPWEGQASCNHKAEKLKCNYDKFVDSHLKPYRCKAESCEGARFSSTACLLRHEREAHGLHGHGDKPFLCVYDGCERAVPGNGFPRQWNLRDHMKRVHNDHGSVDGSPPSGGSAQSVKGRKRKTEAAEPANSTRKATLKSMPVAEPAAPKHIPAKPLLEQWLDQRQVVEEIVRGLNKPDDARSLQQIGDVQKRLAYMATMTKELSSLTTDMLLAETSRQTYSSG